MAKFSKPGANEGLIQTESSHTMQNLKSRCAIALAIMSGISFLFMVYTLIVAVGTVTFEEPTEEPVATAQSDEPDLVVMSIETLEISHTPREIKEINENVRASKRMNKFWATYLNTDNMVSRIWSEVLHYDFPLQNRAVADASPILETGIEIDPD